MKVCFVSRELAPFGGGGIGTYVASAALAFRDAGHEVHVLTDAHRGLEGSGAFPGVQLQAVSPEPGSPVIDAFEYPPMKYAMGVYQRLLSLEALAPFDYVEFPDFRGEGYFALHGKRYLDQFPRAVLAVRLHTPSREVRELDGLGWLDAETACVDHLEDTSFRLADLWVSPTRSLLEKVQARLPKGPPGVVLPYPFDGAWARGVGPVSDPSPSRILYFGRLERRKGVDLLVRAVLRLLDENRDVSLELVGGDTDTGPVGRSMRNHLEGLIPATHRGRFSFAPSRPREALRLAIREATVCCFPSLWENFPNVCLEAMALGAVVVGSDAGGMAEIITDGTDGLLFRSGEVDDLVRVLRRALDEGTLRERISAAAPGRIQTLCEPAIVVTRAEAMIRGATPRPLAPRPRPPAPTVSILVPYFNMGRYLPQTLESLRRQRFDSYEVVIVDDGSTEPASVEALGGLESARVRVLRKPHGGVSSARNVALREARGDWVLPVDPDDLLAPDFLEKTVRTLERHPSLTFATSMASFFDEDPSQPIGGWVPWGLNKDLLLSKNVASTCSALMVKARVEAAGGWDEWMTSLEDWDLFCGLAEQGDEGVVLPELLFFYRVRPDSLMRTEVAERQYRLRSYLIAKHPSLVSDRALRLQLSETAGRDHAPNGLFEGVPLRYRLVDGLNAQLKRAPGLHPLVKRLLRRGEGAPR